MWKGMIVGLAIQSVMAPFNLYENPLIQTVLLRGGLSGLKEKRIFGEKIREEMTGDDNVTDEQGNTIVLKNACNESKKSNDSKKSFEDIVLDTWDLGDDADITSFMSAMTKGNINNVTKENAWSPIMVLSGLGAAGVGDALKRMKDLGANPEIVDKEGWNALHWVSIGILHCIIALYPSYNLTNHSFHAAFQAAFHGSAEAASIILDEKGYNGIALGLHNVADKEGKTPMDLAKEENNQDVAKLIQSAADSNETTLTGATDGMRKRK